MNIEKINKEILKRYKRTQKGDFANIYVQESDDYVYVCFDGTRVYKIRHELIPFKLEIFEQNQKLKDILEERAEGYEFAKLTLIMRRNHSDVLCEIKSPSNCAWVNEKYIKESGAENFMIKNESSPVKIVEDGDIVGAIMPCKFKGSDDLSIQ